MTTVALSLVTSLKNGVAKVCEFVIVFLRLPLGQAERRADYEINTIFMQPNFQVC